MASNQTMRLCLDKESEKINDPAGREIRVIRDERIRGVAEEFGKTIHEAYIEALRIGIRPYRYLRNGDAVSMSEQVTLAESHVAVIGAGGLGGQAILLLARIGVGCLTVVDHDRFEETNLNRQAISSPALLGREKALAASSAVSAINPAVIVRPYVMRLESSNAADILRGCDVVVDALDNVPDRMTLEQTARDLKIHLVHGAVAGFEGHLMTIGPDDPGLCSLFGEAFPGKPDDREPERILGVPAITAAFVASLQVMEVIKILLQRGDRNPGTLLHINLESGRFHRFRLGDHS